MSSRFIVTPMPLQLFISLVSCIFVIVHHDCVFAKKVASSNLNTIRELYKNRPSEYFLNASVVH